MLSVDQSRKYTKVLFLEIMSSVGKFNCVVTGLMDPLPANQNYSSVYAYHSFSKKKIFTLFHLWLVIFGEYFSLSFRTLTHC